jgi:predicted metallopeptidase
MATEYRDAPEVEEIAQRLITEYVELEECEEAKVKYIFKISDKSDKYGTCSLASGKWKFLTDYDYVIEMWEAGWDELSAQQREALTYHELRHIMKVLKIKEDAVEVKWRIRKHTYEFFIREFIHYGPWNAQYKELFETLRGLMG